MPQKKQLIIALDFDDVCIDFNSTFAEYCRVHHNTSYRREDIENHDLSLMLNCSFEESLKRMYTFVHSDFHTMTPPIKGAVEAIIHPRVQGVQLHVVAARNKVIESQTSHLIEKYFSPGFHSVHFLHENDLPKHITRVFDWEHILQNLPKG